MFDKVLKVEQFIRWIWIAFNNFHFLRLETVRNGITFLLCMIYFYQSYTSFISWEYDIPETDILHGVEQNEQLIKEIIAS